MDRKEKIYLYMNSADYTPLNFEELRIVLDVPQSDIAEFYGILAELISEGKIFLSKKKRYTPCSLGNLFPGKLRTSVRGGFGFVVLENSENDIYIPKDALGGALDGDSVLAKAEKTYRGRTEGRIVKILERTNRTLSAVMNGDFEAVPDNPRITSKITLSEVGTASPGDRVLIEITDYAKNGKLFGNVISVFGNCHDIKTLSDAIIFENGIKSVFDDDTLTEARSFPKEPNEDDFKSRLDLRNEIIFTIDGKDARDFDDAVSLKTYENGTFELGVHIADVTHYVQPGSALEREAFERCTSVYLPGRVIPMLPEELSNGLCSLNPHVDRLTLSVIMQISKNGDVTDSRIEKSVIRSCERMTYDDTAKIIDKDPELCEKYEKIVPIIESMHKLSEILAKRRKNRGSINFDFSESKIILNEHGEPKEIQREVRNDAHRLIEEFMLLANETVSEFAFWADIPFVYRVHKQPSAEKTEAFRRFIGIFGLYMHGREIYPKDLQRILEEIKNTENETLIATYMLRSLMKAEYSPECLGHFGLAAKYYCHFTSPIRRYPDLAVHRILKDYILGGDVEKYREYVPGASSRSSEKERAAELCERNISDLFKAAYISDFVGAEFPATVSGITNFGMFAELENTVEGLIRLETIDGDYYEFDEENCILIGKRRGKIYTIGDKIEIEVVRADLLSRQIDFVLKGSKSSSSPRNTAAQKKKTQKRGRKKWKNSKL